MFRQVRLRFVKKKGPDCPDRACVFTIKSTKTNQYNQHKPSVNSQHQSTSLNITEHHKQYF